MKARLPTIAWVSLGLLLLVSLGIDYVNMSQGGAIDLRNRITGIRLMTHQIDAYHYKWTRAEPEEFCDPYNNPLLPVSKTTATPTLLLLHLPLAELRYGDAEVIWFILQWALLLATAALWLTRCSTGLQRLWFAAFVAGFTYTAAWRLHTERGQAYVLLLFLFAGWLVATLDSKTGNRFLTGMLAGFLMALRPPFLLLAPFLALHRRGQLVGAAVGLFLGAGLPLLVYPAGWPHYYTAMEEHSHLYRNDIDPAPGPQVYPPTIEDMPTDTLGNYVAIPYADFSAHAFLRWLGFEPFPALPILLAVVAPFGFWLWLARDQKPETLLPGLAAWFFLIDLALPAYRDSYNDVMILNLIALGVLQGASLPRAAWLALLALPVGWIIYLFAPTQAWLIDLPSLLLTLAAVLFLFPFDALWIAHQSRRR